MNTWDAAENLADRMATTMASRIDFEIFYQPTAEEWLHAKTLNARFNGERLQDKRTRGAKYLKKLRQKSWEEYQRGDNQ